MGRFSSADKYFNRLISSASSLVEKMSFCDFSISILPVIEVTGNGKEFTITIEIKQKIYLDFFHLSVIIERYKEIQTRRRI